MSTKNNQTCQAIIIFIYLWTLNKQQEFDSKFLSLCPCLSSRGIHAGADVVGCPDIVIVTPGCRPFLALLGAEAASSWGGWCATRSEERRQLSFTKTGLQHRVSSLALWTWSQQRGRLQKQACGQSESPGEGWDYVGRKSEWVSLLPPDNYHVSVQTQVWMCVTVWMWSMVFLEKLTLPEFLNKVICVVNEKIFFDYCVWLFGRHQRTQISIALSWTYSGSWWSSVYGLSGWLARPVWP